MTSIIELVFKIDKEANLEVLGDEIFEALEGNVLGLGLGKPGEIGVPVEKVFLEEAKKRLESIGLTEIICLQESYL